MTAFLVTGCLAYGLGSIPFGYILVRVFRGEDVRQSGSGNIGATNVARSSPMLGLLTLGLDGLKGITAVWLAHSLFPGQSTVAAWAALSAILGHVYPVWLKFRGGKGVATALGAFALLAPKAMLATLAIFVGVVLLFRHVSLGSIVSVALFPILAWRRHPDGETPAVVGLMAAASILIVAKHHENIRRLLAGTENRFPGRRE
jgi:glycerol-3-phosphate acyltransferase PlsY